jgi:hypothetical protein
MIIERAVAAGLSGSYMYLKEGFGWIDARYREVWISGVEQVGDLIAGANKTIKFDTE